MTQTKYNRLGTALGLLVTFAVVISLVRVYASPQDDARTGATAPHTVVSVASPALATNHVLKATYINTCQPNCSEISLPAATFNNLDTVNSINCPAPLGHTCTINMEAWIETQDTSGSDGNATSLSLLLDGVTAGQTFFDGDSPVTPGNFTGLAYKSVAIPGVSRGVHTVQTQARSINGANAFAWQTTYTVYVP